MSDARRVALAAIIRVTEHGGYSNLTLPGALRKSDLTGEDRTLAAELTYGTLRKLVALDWAIGRYATRPVHRMTSSARAVLRLGAYQVLFTRIPAHAAVSESVSLAASHERGFVNAVLRRLSSEPLVWPSGDAASDIAIRTGVSGWIVDELDAVLGTDVEAAAAALGERAPLSIRTNTCRTSVDALREALRDAGVGTRAATLHPDVLLLDGGDPARLPGFDEGWFAVQDQASAFVVAALDPQPGDRVADLCAGPGGKAAHIACLVGPDGLLVAADVHPRRAGLVERAVSRLGVSAAVLAQDAARPAIDGTFDRILVDAPCSGLGSTRRRPELLWRGRRGELAGLARRQLDIGCAAADLLKTGGRLVYSVCTFPQEETDRVCDALLDARPWLEPVPIDGPDGPAARVRVWPHVHGSDAMFAAAFRRRA